MRQEVLRPVDIAAALELCRRSGQGYEQLAATLGVSVSSNRELLVRVARKIEPLLESYCHDGTTVAAMAYGASGPQVLSLVSG